MLQIITIWIINLNTFFLLKNSTIEKHIKKKKIIHVHPEEEANESDDAKSS